MEKNASENNTYFKILCNLSDTSHVFLEYNPKVADYGFFTLGVGADCSVGIDISADLKELPKMIKRLTEFKEHLEKQGVKFEGGKSDE